jgi:hypothetical protein
LALVEPDERGDPMSPLRWTTRSLRQMAEELTRQGQPVSAPTVGRLMKREGFSLQANVKTIAATRTSGGLRIEAALGHRRGPDRAS